MTGEHAVKITHERLAVDGEVTHTVTAQFEAAEFEAPVLLDDLREVVDAALPLWGEAVVSVRVDGIWHTPDALRIELIAPVDPLAPVDADHAETADEYADAHEVR